MNLHTIRDNLKNTIAGKEKYLEEVRKARADIGYGPSDIAQDAALHATQEFLKINLVELKKILADVEQCIPAEPEFNDNDSEEVRNLIKIGR